MQNVLTLVAPGADTGARSVARAVTELARRGASVKRPPGVLAEGLAYDVAFEGPEAGEALRHVRQAVGEGVDLAAQPAEGRARRLLIADMESTVIENEMLDELAEHVGARQEVAEITARAMNGELDFKQALRRRVALLEGLPASVLETCRQRIRIDAGAATLVATLKAHGVVTALVSGGFMVFAEAVAEELGFDHCRANRLEVRRGLLTGRTAGPVLDRDAKVQALDELCAHHGCRRQDAVAIGDGANDLPMLCAAGLGVAYRGKPSVARAAPQRLDVGDLSTLLYYLGYPASDWHTQGGVDG